MRAISYDSAITVSCHKGDLDKDNLNHTYNMKIWV